jgi:hypothetical protein
MFIIFVASVEDFAAQPAAVFEAVGKVNGLDMILNIVLGAMLEVGANCAEPG